MKYGEIVRFSVALVYSIKPGAIMHDANIELSFKLPKFSSFRLVEIMG